MIFVKSLLVGLGLLAAAIVLARTVFALPGTAGRVDSRALPPDESARLAQTVRRLWDAHPGQTGVAALGSGTEAFAARMILADTAHNSIDAQYYIWHDDLTGTLLLDALKRAADRGVRVRLLLDDNGTSGLDPELASLDAHPNAEVRL